MRSRGGANLAPYTRKMKNKLGQTEGKMLRGCRCSGRTKTYGRSRVREKPSKAGGGGGSSFEQLEVPDVLGENITVQN